MAVQAPPYHTPIYLESVSLGQVAEVFGDLLDINGVNPADKDQQQWNLDPWQMQKNQYFLKLNKDTTMVVQSPEEEQAQAFMAVQGDATLNGGIQVWVLEQVGSNVWTFKNYKTEMYLYAEDRGEPGISPVIVQSASPQDLVPEVQWKIIQ